MSETAISYSVSTNTKPARLVPFDLVKLHTCSSCSHCEIQDAKLYCNKVINNTGSPATEVAPDLVCGSYDNAETSKLIQDLRYQIEANTVKPVSFLED